MITKLRLRHRSAWALLTVGALLLSALLSPLQVLTPCAQAAGADSAGGAASGARTDKPVTAAGASQSAQKASSGGLLGVNADNIYHLPVPSAPDERFNMQNFLGKTTTEDDTKAIVQARIAGYTFLRGLNAPSTRVAVGQSPNRDYAQIQAQLAAQQQQQSADLSGWGDLSALLFGAGSASTGGASTGGTPLASGVTYLTDAQVSAITGWSTSKASWYGPGFYGNTTADGTVYTDTIILVANKTLPLGTKVAINYNGRTVVAPVKDRGPYVAGRDFDLSAGLAAALGFSGVQTIRWAIVP